MDEPELDSRRSDHEDAGVGDLDADLEDFCPASEGDEESQTMGESPIIGELVGHGITQQDAGLQQTEPVIDLEEPANPVKSEPATELAEVIDLTMVDSRAWTLEGDGFEYTGHCPKSVRGKSQATVKGRGVLVGGQSNDDGTAPELQEVASEPVMIQKLFTKRPNRPDPSSLGTHNQRTRDSVAQDGTQLLRHQKDCNEAIRRQMAEAAASQNRRGGKLGSMHHDHHDDDVEGSDQSSCGSDDSLEVAVTAWKSAKAKKKQQIKNGKFGVGEDIAFRLARDKYEAAKQPKMPRFFGDGSVSDVFSNEEFVKEQTPGYDQRRRQRKQAANDPNNIRAKVAQQMSEEKIEASRKKAKEGKGGRKRKRDYEPDQEANAQFEDHMRRLEDDAASNLVAPPPVDLEDGTDRNEDEVRATLVTAIAERRNQERTSYAERIREARAILGTRNVSHIPDENRFTLRGLRTSLYPHQLLGVAWMLARERNRDWRGGINGDEMGFGKTVQSLATMVANQAAEGEVRATLVVCPSSLAQQWLDEIGRHVDVANMRIVLHRQGNRVDGLMLEDVLKSSFCVITTYSEVRRSVANADVPNELTTEDQINEWYRTTGKDRLDFLHAIHWHRIILDECTAIKSYQSATAKACFLLHGNHRWLLSGTPLINGVDEFYSYLLFLQKAAIAGSVEHFKSNFISGEESMRRAQKLMHAVMIRRTHDDCLDGQKIFHLPPTTRTDVDVKFSHLEQVIFEVCCRRFCFFINGEMKRHAEMEARENGVHTCKRIHHILLCLLRLRQIATHPMLAGETIRKVLNSDDRRIIRRALADRMPDVEHYDMMTRVKKMLSEADASQRNDDSSSDVGDIPNGGDFGRSQISGKSFMKLIDDLTVCEEEEEQLCVYCGTVPLPPHEVPLQTSCGHVYCKSCFMTHARDEFERGRANAKCKACQRVVKSVSSYDQWTSPREKKRFLDRNRQNRDLGWINDGKRLMPSAKLTAVKAIVLEWLAKEPETKIIIFTQFRPVISCLARICKDEGWSYLPYHGGINVHQRDNVVERFRTDPDISILLASLKAGGVGLNLTCASKLISIDLWWNFATESQAFGRVYRIKQQKETDIRRIIAVGSVDERIMEIQKKKYVAIEKVMNGDGNLQNLTTEEALSLFGDVQYDEDQTPFVVPSLPLTGEYYGGSRGVDVSFPPIS